MPSRGGWGRERGEEGVALLGKCIELNRIGNVMAMAREEDLT